METFLILFFFAFCPLAFFTLVIATGIYRAKQKRIIAKAAEKYLAS